ncbi:MAG: amidase [Candidatus Kapaibacterium sp.]
MNRRSFVHTASSSLLALAGAFTSTSKGSSFLAASSSVTMNSRPVFPNLAMHELLEELHRGSITTERLTREYLRRIEAMNIKGPRLRAVICTHPDAMAEARRMDKERARGDVRGPLHGVPLLVKDNIDTRDIPTTAGSVLMASHRPAADASLVARLREAGALVLGKTNLSEWANFRSTRSSSGWSSILGQTRNPHVLDRSPSGSSSGSAVAVAAGLCAAAIGTETDGSIVSPASSCGVVGFKPTVGLVPQDGIIPISATQDTAGPMARTVRDCAMLMNIMQMPSQFDPLAPSTAVSLPLPGHTSMLYPEVLRGKRIGVDASYKNHLGEVVAVFEKSIDMLRLCGADVVEVTLFDTVRAHAGNKEWEVLLYEFRRDLNAYLASSHAPVGTLARLIEANTNDARRCMPLFGQEIFVEADRATDDGTYRAALETTLGVRGLFDDAFAKDRLDAVVCVTSGPAWCIDPVNGDSPTSPSCSSPAAMAGFPHVTVPMGFVRGLPVGLSFMALANMDAQVLGYAYAFEQASKAMRAPAFASTVQG